MRKLLLLIAVLALVAMVGCAKRAVVTADGPIETSASDTTNADGTTTHADGTITNADGQLVNEKGEPIDAGGQVIKDDIGSTTDTGDSTTVDAGREISDISFPDIHFDFDMYDIKAEYRPVLMKVSDWLIKNEGVALIEGYCDDRGTDEYNLALGDRRAKATRDFLMASGVPSRKIEYISYGEDNPLCTEQTESCWVRNRRAHFTIGTR